VTAVTLRAFFLAVLDSLDANQPRSINTGSVIV